METLLRKSLWVVIDEKVDTESTTHIVVKAFGPCRTTIALLQSLMIK